jgi:hypothetical protein
MSYLNYALLRTVGGLAANHAHYGTKIRQLKLEKQSDAVHPTIDVKGALRAMAEADYGPSDPVWEKKHRQGALTAESEMLHLHKLSRWSVQNGCRFLEMLFFAKEVLSDVECTNHLGRLDTSNLELVGADAWMNAMQTAAILDASDKWLEVRDKANPLFEGWYKWITSQSYLTRIAEVQITLDFGKDQVTRRFGELHIPLSFLHQ